MNKAEKIVNKLKKSYVAILMGLFLLLLSSAITISQGTALLKEYYYDTLGHKKKLINDIYKLAPSTNIGYFERILGNPVFVNEKTDEKNTKEPTQKEYIFINDYFYVQAITGKNEKVLAYSVTGEDLVFNIWSGIKNIDLKLGKSTFEVVDDKPEKIELYCGARRGGYSEEYYFGNPGNYQTYIFSLNDINGGFPQMCLEDVGTNNVSLENEEVRKLRKEQVINTFTITSPGISGKDLLFGQGPDMDQVRILNRFK